MCRNKKQEAKRKMNLNRKNGNLLTQEMGALKTSSLLLRRGEGSEMLALSPPPQENLGICVFA